MLNKCQFSFHEAETVFFIFGISKADLSSLDHVTCKGRTCTMIQHCHVIWTTFFLPPCNQTSHWTNDVFKRLLWKPLLHPEKIHLESSPGINTLTLSTGYMMMCSAVPANEPANMLPTTPTPSDGIRLL